MLIDDGSRSRKACRRIRVYAVTNKWGFRYRYYDLTPGLKTKDRILSFEKVVKFIRCPKTLVYISNHPSMNKFDGWREQMYLKLIKECELFLSDPQKWDTVLLTRIIREGGFVNYIRKLEHGSNREAEKEPDQGT